MILPRQFITCLWIGIVVLAIMNVLHHVVVDAVSVETFALFVRKFKLDSENSIPTWFSSMLLLTAAVGLHWVARREAEDHRPDAWRFNLLALAFVYLSCDEAASLHELPGPALKKLLHLNDGPLVFAWVIPAMVVMAGLAVVIWPMFKRMDPALRRGMFAAAAIFVGGALVMEMIGGDLAYTDGVRDKTMWLYWFVVGLEETMEMCGVALLITVTQRHLGKSRPVIDAPSLDPRAMARSRSTSRET